MDASWSGLAILVGGFANRALIQFFADRPHRTVVALPEIRRILENLRQVFSQQNCQPFFEEVQRRVEIQLDLATHRRLPRQIHNLRAGKTDRISKPVLFREFPGVPFDQQRVQIDLHGM